MRWFLFYFETARDTTMCGHITTDLLVSGCGSFSVLCDSKSKYVVVCTLCPIMRSSRAFKLVLTPGYPSRGNTGYPPLDRVLTGW